MTRRAVVGILPKVMTSGVLATQPDCGKEEFNILGVKNSMRSDQEPPGLWRPKRKADQPKASADINLGFILPADILIRKVGMMKRWLLV